MEKKLVKKQYYNFLKAELDQHRNEERISEQQMNEILGFYEIKAGINFINVLIILGSVLIGLGILSFIASNWDYMSKLLRFLLIVFAYIAAIAFSIKFETKKARTSRGLFYLSLLIFGAGIFLTGQMFHFGGSFSGALLIWAIGIYPLTMLERDKFAYAFIHILLIVYLNSLYNNVQFPFILLLMIPALYLGQKVIKADWIIFLTNILTLNFIWYLLNETINLAFGLTVIIFFVIGLILFFVPVPFYSGIIKLKGNLMIAVFGLVLTFKENWLDFEWVSNNNIPIHTIFSVLYFLFLLFMVRSKNLIALIFIGLLIIRFFFDTMYNFLPKSIFFIIGGLFLLGFGYYFEKKRRRFRGEENEE